MTGPTARKDEKQMSLKQTLTKRSTTPDLWGGPLWRRILVAIVGLAVLGGWFFLVEHWLG